MDNIQAMIDGLGAHFQQERIETQMTLGKLIDRLKEFDPDEDLIDAFDSPMSYRGYYIDLAFRKSEGKQRAGELLEMCQGAMGEVFEGYKGGDYQMGRNTPVWIAPYGSTGDRIMAIQDDGSLVLEPEPDDSA